jgi:hypothetical protein
MQNEMWTHRVEILLNGEWKHYGFGDIASESGDRIPEETMDEMAAKLSVKIGLPIRLIPIHKVRYIVERKDPDKGWHSTGEDFMADKKELELFMDMAKDMEDIHQVPYRIKRAQ